MSRFSSKNSGFVKTIILIVIGLIVLGFLGFNLEEIVKKETVQKNLQYAWGLAKIVWQKFLATPAMWVWKEIVIDLFWENLVELLAKIKN